MASSWLTVLLAVGGVDETLCYFGEDDTNLAGNLSKVLPSKLNASDGVHTVLSKSSAALLLLLGFGGLGLILAFIHRFITKTFYPNMNKLDSTFDAGGNISWSLTAVTVASQFLWPGDLLHPATLMVKFGIAGPFWYTVAILATFLLLPLFTVRLKTRAPGAKTFLQVFLARFGRKCHIVFCVFGLLTAAIIVTCTLLSGRAMIHYLVEDVSDEFVILVIAFLFGSYAFVGGLKTTFYVSYFNASLVFIVLIVFTVRIFYMPGNLASGSSFVGNLSLMYESIDALQGPDGNWNRSFLTFRSTLGLIYGGLTILVAAPMTYCDQALWQSRIAAKPLSGVVGFLLGGLIWLTVPMTMATVTGLSYLSLSYENGSHLLTLDEINAGLVTPCVAERLLGKTGGILILSMGTMALMSTGSGEVMGISSIIVYDIYQVYIKPFRKGLKTRGCILCGNFCELITREDVDFCPTSTNDSNTCKCLPVESCPDCRNDVQGLKSSKIIKYNEPYSCEVHGPYRAYQDELARVKNWCILSVTLALIPFGLVIFKSGVDLNWMYHSSAVLILPCFVPLILSIGWSKATAKGLSTGSLSGVVAGVSALLICAQSRDGGLSNFIRNTSHELSFMVGSVTAFLVSLSVSVIGSLLTHNIKTVADEEAEWEKTRQIDNPLNPWHVYYKHELQDLRYAGRPSMAQISRVFKSARFAALVGGLSLVVSLLIILPSILCIFPSFSFTQFTGWLTVSHCWTTMVAIVVVFAAPIHEVVTILRQKRRNQTNQIPPEKDHFPLKPI